MPPRTRPNLLFITIDTCRADRIGCLGNPSIRTPNIDALAARGALFTQAVCQVPTTLPSHASIFTGLNPTSHGVRDNGRFHLQESAVTLAEILRDAGYRTGAFVGAFPVAAQFGLAQGFEVYSDELPRLAFRGRAAISERRGDEVTEGAIEWLSKQGDAPFFAWVHFFDPHWPYEPPGVYAALYADRAYEGEIAFVDGEIGRLVGMLEDAGLADETLVVVMSDHGEGLGEHLEFSHSVLIYDGTIRIPLVIAPAGAAPKTGLLFSSQARSIDVMPTVLDLAGLSIPSGLDGTTLRRTEETATDLTSCLSYTETYTPWYGFQWSPLRGLRADGWKFIEAPQSELYDLAADPNEKSNLLAARPAKRKAWQRALDDLGVERASSAERDMDAETVEKLRALGYVGAGRALSASRPSRGDGDLPNPIQMIDTYFYYLAPAAGMYGHGEFASAIALCDSALTHDPTNLQALVTRSHALNHLGRHDEAQASYERLLSLDPENVGAHFALAAIAFEREDYEAAERGYRYVLTVDPGIVEARHDLALALKRMGRTKEAEEALRQAAVSAPEFAPIYRSLGDLYFEEGRRREALAAYLEGFAVEPTNRDLEAAVRALVAEDSLGEGALRELESAHERDPESKGRRIPLITVAFERGEKERAWALLREGLAKAPSAALYRIQAWMHKTDGRSDLAVRDLEAGVALEPQSAFAHVTLAAFYGSLGRLDDAKVEYEAALEIDPRNESALLGLGNIYADWKQLGRAMTLWERAVIENPKSPAGKNIEKARRMLEGGGI